ncbi:MAG: hypothetical protein Q7J14_00055 [Candidatus Magasanikbacteria bacterium]|nr:hypothetical protein [Candidatus Magasanikbacteria bacterium]
MLKKLFSFFTLFAVIILIGAGCQNTASIEVEEINDIYSFEKEDLFDEEENDLILSVETLGKNQVKFIWNNSNNPGGYKMMHSAREDAENPFWQNIITGNDEATFYNVPTGTRYFQICEMEEKECVNYSNKIELEVE